MDKIFDSKMYPILVLLVSITIGVVSSLMGASASVSILIAILMEVIITLHHVVIKIQALQNMLGLTKGLNSLFSIIPKINKILTLDNKWMKFVLSSKLEKIALEVDYLEKERIPLLAEEFMEFAEKLFTSLGKNDKIYATSLFGGGDYWKRKYGIKYAKLNKIATDNGAVITRTFIPQSIEARQQLENIIKEQSLYVNIRLVDFDDLSDIDKRATKDFFILNDELVVEFIFDAPFRDIDCIVLITSKDEINNFKKRMNKIIDLSVEYENKEKNSYNGR